MAAGSDGAPYHGSEKCQEEARRLSALVAACSECKLYRARTRSVFGSGFLAAQLMVVGEAPGATEDQEGIPFVGRSGMLLRKYLKEENLGPDKVFITNTVRCRPPNNRDPFPAEIYACGEHLHRVIELVRPRALLAVGAVASKVLTGEMASMAEYRKKSGEWVYRTPYPIEFPVFCTYHPAYILRRPDMASVLREDLQKVRRYIDGEPSP